ncbi:MFS transporter [Streptomyces sp. Q6]|uniref:MFS transporter n=1 Tax=Streptomyces citrinus TaxID=3118173 RepID=A0ACD5AK19_9ACTN
MGKRRSLSLFWAGYAASQIGTAAWRLALPWVALVQTSSVWSLVAVSLATIVPELVFGPLGGTLADRLPRLPTLMTMDAGRMVLYGITCLLVIGSGDHSSAITYGLTAVQALDASVGILYTSTRTAVLRELSTHADVPLKSLLGKDRAVRNTADIVGTGAGGAMVAATSMSVVLGVNAASFLLALIGLSLVWSLFPREARWVRPATKARDGKSFTWEGARIAKHQPLVRDALSRQLVLNLPMPVITLGFPLILEARGASATMLGLTWAAFSLGSLGMSLYTGRRKDESMGNRPRRGWLITAGATFLLAAALTLPTPCMPVLLVVLGVLFTRTLLDANLQWQTRLDSQVTGRVAALASVLARVAAVLSTVAVAAVASWGHKSAGLPSTALAITVIALGFLMAAPCGDTASAGAEPAPTPPARTVGTR